MGELTATEYEQASKAAIVACVLSITGDLIVLGTGLGLSKLRANQRVRIILAYAFAELVATLGYMLGAIEWFNNGENPSGTDSCRFQFVVIQLFKMSSAIWAGCMAVYLYLAIAKQLPGDEMRKAVIAFHVVSWGVPLILLILTLTIPDVDYGNSGVWCWLLNSPKYVRWVFFYCQIWFLMVFIPVMYAVIMINVKQSLELFSGKTKVAKVWSQMCLYPLSFIIAWLPSSINRLQNTADPNNPLAWLYILQAFFLPLQGFMDALIYCYNTRLYYIIYAALHPGVRQSLKVRHGHLAMKGGTSGSGDSASSSHSTATNPKDMDMLAL